MEIQSLAVFREELAYIALGAVFVFFGFACCAVAAIRQRTEVRVLVWLGIWSGMYGANLLLRTTVFEDALPHWLRISVPFAANTISYLLVVVGLLVWSELTLDKMRLLTQAMAVVGLAIAAGGIGEFIATRSGAGLLPYNNLLAACALISLGTVVVVPRLSVRFLAFPNRILTVSTVVFSIDALYRNACTVLRLPNLELPLLIDDVTFAGFLFSFAYVAGEKVFAGERRLLAIESELEIARQIQASILPAGTPEVEDLCIAASYLPMTAVGGDFYQFVQVDRQRVGFLVADVSGHGIPAALISTMLKVAMQSAASCAEEPGGVLSALNRILSGQLRGQLISAAYLWIDTETHRALYSSAGHPPLLRWSAGRLERIESNGLLFGVLPDLDYPVRKMALNAGDRFLLYTDGVVEPENAAGEAFGAEELERVIRKNEGRTPEELSKRLLAEVRHWQPATASQQDDITLIVIDVVKCP
jgi:sigma-B regulation protein RsbU (phosphoserine phosphatase)